MFCEWCGSAYIQLFMANCTILGRLHPQQGAWEWIYTGFAQFALAKVGRHLLQMCLLRFGGVESYSMVNCGMISPDEWPLGWMMLWQHIASHVVAIQNTILPSSIPKKSLHLDTADTCTYTYRTTIHTCIDLHEIVWNRHVPKIFHDLLIYHIWITFNIRTKSTKQT